MNEIYVLKKRVTSQCREFTEEWVAVWWTDNPRDAGVWKKSSHRDEHRDFDIVKKVTPNK